MDKLGRLGEAELLFVRYSEAGQIEDLLRECSQTTAADLVAARLGGMRDALDVLGVDIEAAYEPEPANDTGATGAEPKPAPAPDAGKVQCGKRQFSPEALERLRDGARKQHAQRAAKKGQAA